MRCLDQSGRLINLLPPYCDCGIKVLTDARKGSKLEHSSAMELQCWPVIGPAFIVKLGKIYAPKMLVHRAWMIWLHLPIRMFLARWRT